MFYLIKFFINLLIYILRYVWIIILLFCLFSLLIGIVIPIVTIISILRFMWKFNKKVLIDGLNCIIELCDDICDMYITNKPSFKTWK